MKVQQSQLAEDMGSSASQISRSVKGLVDAGVIERRGSHKYKLNPMVGTMGSRRKRSSGQRQGEGLADDRRGWVVNVNGTSSPHATAAAQRS